MIRIKQREPNGCGLACLAMVTGQTYEKVRTDLQARRYVWLNGDQTPGEHGIHNNVLDLYLERHGFWLQRRYRAHYIAPPRAGARRHRWGHTRDWPCGAWACAHIAQVKQPSGKGHYVVMDAAGHVLDPLREGLFSLRDWPTVENIVGLLRR